MAICDSYPKFEENQVLTAKQLNDLADHLLKADRRSLDKLAGIGVVCGLEPSNPTKSRNSVALSKGCGVTSKGFLVAMDEDATFTRYRSYKDPAGYGPFKSNGGQIDLYELLPTVVADEDSSIKALSQEFLKDKAVLAFMEQKEVDLKTCTAEDCDERGRHVHLCVKVLLIGFSDLKKIILAAHKLSQNTDLDDHFNAPVRPCRRKTPASLRPVVPQAGQPVRGSQKTLRKNLGERRRGHPEGPIGRLREIFAPFERRLSPEPVRERFHQRGIGK